MSIDDKLRTGGCLCGRVQYTLQGKISDVINCFCGQCQKTSGHYFAATRASHNQFNLIQDSTLKWYASSATAKRGFCSECGSRLFWQRQGADMISITAGSLDKPTGLVTRENIFVEDISDYFDLPTV